MQGRFVQEVKMMLHLNNYFYGCLLAAFISFMATFFFPPDGGRLEKKCRESNLFYALAMVMVCGIFNLIFFLLI